jgi:hypothetical protein
MSTADARSASQTNTALATTNVILGVLTVCIALGFIYVQFFYQPDVDPQQTQRYLDEAQQRLEEHGDQIAAEATDVAREALPPIGNAIYQQAQEDYPRYLRALKSEGREYLNNVERILLDEVKAQYRDYLYAHRDVIKEEFPERASDENVERVLRDFEQTANRLLERYYLDEFRKETDRTVALWERVPIVEIPGPNEPSLNEQLADYAADWTVLAMAEETSEAAAETASSDATAPPREARPQ